MNKKHITAVLKPGKIFDKAQNYKIILGHDRTVKFKNSLKDNVLPW